MQDLTERIREALTNEEARAETFANTVRFVLLIVLTVVALVNAPSVSTEANVMNFGTLAAGYTYGFIVFILIRRRGYHPTMKYITSCLDILLVFLLLFSYTKIEVPSVALKNYVFLIVFPLTTLTVFRYDRGLTLVAGGLAVACYLLLMLFLSLSGTVNFVHAGYERELFSNDVTYVGQLTKVLILGGYVCLLAYLTHYSRILFVKLVSKELSARSQNELMDWELNMASQVQTQFLPHSFPELAGLELYGQVQQGRFVGGDYFDFIQLGDGKLLVVIADVSGKGVPAALIMAEVRAVTHSLAAMQIELEELTRRANTLLHQSTDKKSFVTFFAAEVNAADGRLAYVNAGHPPPLILSEGRVSVLAKGTIPLGVCASLPHLTKQTAGFPPGSILLSYTDGLWEQTNLRGDHFGEARIGEFVRANADLDVRAFVQTLLQEIQAFGGGGDLNDDVSISVVKHRSCTSH